MRYLFAVYVWLLVLVVPGLAGSKTVLMLGDSLTAGLGLEASAAFPAQLEAGLKAEGLDVAIINGGVSGDTAAQGEARLDWALTDDVGGVIVALGANDALRGIPPPETAASLERILQKLQARNLPILVLGMRAPPNLGPEYGAAFDGLFSRLSEAHGALLYPFFLDGVAADPTLNQSDGMHPNATGVSVMVKRILPIARELVQKIGP